MAELKKCPFCGGEVKIVPEQIDARTVAYNFVCDECCSSTYFDYADREESIESWNNRATEAEIRTKFAEAVEKRIKEEVALLEQEREEAREYDDEQIIFAVNNQLRAFAYSLRVVAERLKERE